ncbi:hypothetical protein LJR022_009683 [Paraburkholderia hospita]|uniref:hypothetical protein n=1 Tax=Paraburkholderia hospita TaxID=169430 RepID=UPI003ECD4C72
MIGTSICPDVATPFIAANFAREKLMASVAAQSNRKDNDTMNEQKALAPWPFCGVVPRPVCGARNFGISEPFREIRMLIRIGCRTTGSPNAAPLR